MVSRWLRQRRNVLLPEPDGPMTTTTPPSGTCRLIPLKTSSLPNRLQTLWASTMGVTTHLLLPPASPALSFQYVRTSDVGSPGNAALALVEADDSMIHEHSSARCN